MRLERARKRKRSFIACEREGESRKGLTVDKN